MSAIGTLKNIENGWLANSYILARLLDQEQNISFDFKGNYIDVTIKTQYLKQNLPESDISFGRIFRYSEIFKEFFCNKL